MKPCDLRTGDRLEAACRTCHHAVLAHDLDSHVCEVCDYFERAITNAEPMPIGRHMAMLKLADHPREAEQ